MRYLPTKTLSLNNKVFRFLFIFLGLIVLLIVLRLVQVLAFVPSEINFQGKLTDSNGINVSDGYYDFRVRIYDAGSSATPPSGGNVKQTIDLTDIYVRNGIFNLKFSPSDSTLASPNGEDRYLQVCFNSSSDATASQGYTGSGDGISICNTSSNDVFDKAFSPRKKLTSNPYSLMSKMLGSNIISGDDSGVFTIGIDQAGGTANTTGQIKFISAGDNAYSTIFQPGTQSGNIVYTLPTAQAAGAGYTLSNNGSGVLSWAAPGAAATVPFSGLTAATATNTIDNSNYAQIWDWSTNTTGTGLTMRGNGISTGSVLGLSSTSTAGGASGSSKVLNVTRSGTNTNSSHTAYGVSSSVTNTGTTSTNIAGYFNASGATNNYAGIFENGNVGIGTTAPVAKLHNAGSTLFGTLTISNRTGTGSISIGTAATTVDIYTSIAINQTTPSKVLILPDPTNTTAGRSIYVTNVGTTYFNFYGISLKPNESAAAIWDGDSWNISADGAIIKKGTATGLDSAFWNWSAPLSKDSFTDTNGTLLTSHTPNIGSSWSNTNNSQWTIQSNKLSRTNNIIDFSVVDVGQSDMIVCADFTALNGPVNSVLARRQDGNHYWEIFYNIADGGWQMSKVNGGPDDFQGPLLGGTTGTACISAVGNTITGMSPNGDTFSIVDSDFNTSTNAALILSGSGSVASTVDNWIVAGRATSTATKLSEITILDNGNVGIGDTTPSNLFTVGAGDTFQVGSSGAIAAATGITSSGTITFSGLNTAGGIVYTNGSGQLGTSAAGTSGYVLTSTGSGAPTWTDPSTLSAGSVAFNNITGGTNTSAAMVVGAGGSLNYTSTGTINASSLQGNTWAAPGAIGSTTPNTGAFTTISGTQLNLTSPTNGALMYSVKNTSSQTVFSMYDSGSTFWNPVPATSLATTKNSAALTFRSAYWNGSASVEEGTTMQAVRINTTAGGYATQFIDNDSLVSMAIAGKGGQVSVGYAFPANGNLATLGQFHVRSLATTTTTATFRAIASQTANITEWQNSGGTAIGSVGSVVDTTTTAGNYNIFSASPTLSGVFTTGTTNLYGVKSTATTSGVSSGGTQNTYGGYFTSTGENTGAATSSAVGIYASATGGDTNYAGIFASGNVGIGDTTPAALFTVGSNDAFQITNAGTVTAGTWNGTALTDAYVSDTLTSSLFVGSGSTTNAIDLATAEVSGTLPIANGGTNSTATPTNGGVAYGTGTAYAFTSAGTSGYVLQSNGAAAPTWVATSTLTAGSVAFNNVSSGTNTSAAMVVGAGASLNYTSTGTINASTLIGGTWASPGAIGSTSASTGAFTSLTASSTFASGSSSQFQISAAGVVTSGTWNGTALTDTYVSDTLTSSLFVGSGSTTTAIDLATAEVAGTLPVANGGTNSTATPTNGGISYGTGTAYAFTSAGTSGYLLKSNGAAAPTWVDSSTLTAGAVAFNNITGGTNTSAAMIVGAGGSLNYTSTGTINASTLIGGTWASPGAIGSTSPSTGAFTTLSANSTVTFSALTSGSVPFIGTSGVLSQSNGQFYWDNTNSRLGVGTSSPGAKLAVDLNTSDTVSNQYASKVALTQTSASSQTATGLDLSVSLNSTTGTQQGLNGIQSTVRTGNSGGGISFAKGISSWGDISSGKTIGDFRLFEASNPANSGTITSLYGLYVSDMTAGATNYSIYAAGSSQSYFGGKVGIGSNSASAAKLEVSGGSVLFNGATGTTPTSGAGTRFMWIPSKAALRAGVVTGTNWDDANIGSNSIVFGTGSNAGIASGAGSVVIGTGIASGSGSMVFGAGTASNNGNIVIGSGTANSASTAVVIGGGSSTGIQSIALGGNGVSASGHQSFAGGYNTTASGHASVALGKETIASGITSFALGYNVTAGTADYTMAIGTGYNNAGTWTSMVNNTANSLAIGFNSDTPTVYVGPGTGLGASNTGSVGIGNTSPAAKFDVTGGIRSSGSSSGITFVDRTSSRLWQWYGTSDITRLYNGSSDVLTISNAGLATLSGGINVSGGTASFTPRISAAGGINSSTTYLQVDGGSSGDTYFNGDVGIGVSTPGAGLHVKGTGQASVTPTTASSMGGALILQDSGGTTNNGGFLVFGASQGHFAGIKGLINNGGTNTTGDLSFLTRNAVTDSTLTERMRILTNGAVGINVSNPGSKLVVADTSSFSTANIMNYQTGDSTNYSATVFRVGTATTGVNTRFLKFVAASSSEITGTGVGRIRLNGTGVAYETGGADFAEYFDVAETVSTGDIVSMTSGGNKKSTSSDNKVLGVVSETAAFVGNAKTEEPAPNQAIIGVLGQISTKVSSENGDIQAGDFITVSSKPGVGMKSTTTGFVIGKALESYTNTDPNAVGTIKVFVSPMWYAPTLAQSTTPSTDNWTVAGGDLMTDYNVVVNGDLTANTIQSTALVSKSININNGKFTVNSNGDVVSQGSFTSNSVTTTIITTANATISTLKVDKLAINQTPTTGDATIGTGTIVAGEQTVVVNNANITTGSKIFLSITSESGDSVRVINKVANTSFTVKLNTISTQDVTFDYWIIAE